MDSESHHSVGSSIDHGVRSGLGAVAAPRAAAVTLGGSLPCSLDSLDDLARWRDEVVDLHRHVILSPSTVPGVAGSTRNGAASPEAHPVAIFTLEALLAASFDRMQRNGALAADADPARLATGLTAALRGGSLLARTTCDIAPLEVALDFALSYVRSQSTR